MMKDIDESARLTIELAKLLMAEMQAMNEPWQKAFLRLEFLDDVETYKGAFVLADSVQLFDVFKHKQMFSVVKAVSPRLREAQANATRKFCVALLVVDSAFNYEVLYEYDDVTRWAISKLNGSTGIPVGVAA